MSLRMFFLLRALFALAGLLAGSGTAMAFAGELPRPVVVELYTSQGCSSCPPADAILSQLAQRKDVLALSLPITYWDMLGWKDTLASDANTKRQKGYAAVMGRGGIYTPQMIVDGVDDVVGSRANAAAAAIAAREADMRAVPVSLKLGRSEMHVDVGGGGKSGDDATIWLFRVQNAATVKIGGGENDGHTVTYRNVVREVKAIGMWKGKPVSLDLPLDAIGGNGRDGIAVVVQEDGYGRIVGASGIDTPGTAQGR